jgi:hypothetical protein
MKTRSRPPLKLKDADGPVVADVSPEAVSPEAGSPEAALAVNAEPVTPPEPRAADEGRPMSERRRRRLAQEAAERERQAEAAAAPEVVAPLSAGALTSVEETAPPVATPSTSRAEPITGARHAYTIAILAALLWVGGVASWFAFEIGAGRADMEPLRLAVYALVALAPAGLAILMAQAVRQGAGLAAETRRARAMTDALVGPTASAAGQVTAVVSALKTDIDQACLATERARNDMALLRESLSEETTRLNEAAELAQRTARRLSEQLSREREAMQSLGSQLDTQATGVVDAVERQSRMVADASDLAQVQLREAETALAARAADLAAAATEAQDAARMAADDLSRQTLRLENAGSGVSEQIQLVEEGLSQQRAALVTAAYALRTDQEDFSAQVESQKAQLTETLSAATSVTGDLMATSERSVGTLRDLVEAAADQFRALSDLSSREADAFDNATKQALDRFEALAADARDTLTEETRRAMEALNAVAVEQRAAAEDAADQAQLRADRLGEALFEAAQKADHAADSRVDGARRIVEETVGLVDEAGERAVRKLEETISRMTGAVGLIDSAMIDLDARAQQMPEEARARIEQVRAVVEEGLTALADASRKAAEDTETLDAAFQERVKRNYDMLSEAVRLMGVVSGDSPVAAARRREAAQENQGAVDTDRSGNFGLRGRLKLTPGDDAAPANEGRRAPARPARDDDSLNWRDLVEDTAQPAARMPEPEAPAPVDDALAERIAAAIRRMGVDPNALLPRARVEEAAAAIQDREPDRARQIVRRVAPAAVRSVSRRVLSDPSLKADAERYARGFAHELSEASRGDAEGYSVLSRLATDAGRAFLLLDAAVGDLA